MSDRRQNEELDTRISKSSAVMRAFHYSVVMKYIVEKGKALNLDDREPDRERRRPWAC